MSERDPHDRRHSSATRGARGATLRTFIKNNNLLTHGGFATSGNHEALLREGEFHVWERASGIRALIAAEPRNHEDAEWSFVVDESTTAGQRRVVIRRASKRFADLVAAMNANLPPEF